MDIIEGLLKHQVLFVERALKRDLDDILAAEVPGRTNQWGHSNYRHPAHTLAYLYQCGHPANPLQGDEWLRETAVRLIDTLVEVRDRERATHPKMGETEWPPYATCYAVQALGKTLNADRLARWRRYVTDWVDVALVEPAFFTSPNHELWRFLVLHTAGLTFDEPDWCETALTMCHQLIHWQTPEGFWEEGVHHGPSMKYNYLSMVPLAWLYRRTGDELIGDAARRLAAFMVRYTFPDGTTVGCIDGRQSMSPDYFAPACPGLDLVPGGLTLVQRMIDQRERLEAFNDVRALDSSNWYAYFGINHVTDACLYFEDVLAERDSADDDPLPIDADGAALANHTTTFDGVMARKGPWVGALSGQESDVPKIGSWIYRLERQSRISLWHERVGVVLGGGHNLTKQRAPLANVVMITGSGPTVEHGLVSRSEGKARSVYICRAADSDWTDDGGRLTVHFLHGSVTFQVVPVDDRTAEVRFEWSVRGVERLAIQVPIVIWRGGAITIPGDVLEGPPEFRPSEADGPTAALLIGGVTAVTGPIRVEHDRLGYAFEVTSPDVGSVYARYPMEPIRSYGKLFDEEGFDSPYTICLLGTQIDNPAATGTGRFGIGIH